MTVTLRFQSTGAVPGDGRPVVMHGRSLTIGRGAENDLVLPDPNREVSGRHCVIENHNGNIVVVDLSSNGTFLNYGKIPLGRTPTPLNDGDVLSMGPYEIVVAVQAGHSPAELLEPAAEQRFTQGNAARAPDPLSLLDDAAPGGDFLDSLLGDATPRGPRHMKIGDDPFDSLLPPLGEDEGPLLAPRRDMPTGPAVADHGAAVSDAFQPRAASQPQSVIPDDWEDDLLAPPAGGAGGGTRDDPFGSFAVAPAPASHTPQPVGHADDPFAEAGDAPAQVSNVIPDIDLDDLVPAGVEEPSESEAVPADTPPISAPVFLPEDTAPPAALETAGSDPVAQQQAAPVPDAVPAAAQDMASGPAVTPAGAGDLGVSRAFIEAMGAGEVKLSDADMAVTMPRLGRTLRAMITGLREILMTRTSIKSEFRIEQTMISAGGNNPLKFSITPEQAIEAMAKPAAKGYLDAETAALQALNDIKAHEVAMVTGMEAALKGVLARLDPAELTGKIEAKGGFGGLFKGKKAQYWETYEKMYAEIADQAENDFHELFSREFANAYKDQLARLKAGQS